VSGKKWLTLHGRDGCKDSSGWLGGDFCVDGQDVRLWSSAGGRRSTWGLEAKDGAPLELLNKTVTFQVRHMACMWRLTCP
jgi:hypothetical protein